MIALISFLCGRLGQKPIFIASLASLRSTYLMFKPTFYLHFFLEGDRRMDTTETNASREKKNLNKMYLSFPNRLFKPYPSLIIKINFYAITTFMFIKHYINSLAVTFTFVFKVFITS